MYQPYPVMWPSPLSARSLHFLFDYNLMEGTLEVLVVNAAHMKNVPGRKTDVKDAEWIADLLRLGLLQASFIPDRPQRELRELTRYRTSLLQERSAEVNRLQKTLEGANIKLSAVATDIMGKSGRDMLAALVAGRTDAAALAQLARGNGAVCITVLRSEMRPSCTTSPLRQPRHRS